MINNIKFRNYKAKDTLECAKIIAATWSYDKYYPEYNKAMNLSILMFQKYSIDSDYREIAVDENDTIVGILFAKTKKPSIFRKMKGLIFNIIVLFKLLMGHFGKKSILLNIMREIEETESVLLKGFTSSDVFLNLFFTTKQGIGLGKALLTRFEDICKKDNKDRIVLSTDTDCNYGFYDKAGYKQTKKIDGLIGVVLDKEEKAKHSTFIYEKDLK